MDWFKFSKSLTDSDLSLQKTILDIAMTLWMLPEVDSLIAKAKNPKFNPKDKTHMKVKWGEVNIIDNLQIFFVNGNEIKDKDYMDFVEGGNDMVYGKKSDSKERTFIPDNEIWVDANLSPVSCPYVLVHELFERTKMRQDKKDKTEEEFSDLYDHSHILADKFEKSLRMKQIFENAKGLEKG